MNLPAHVSEATKRLNPQLYPAGGRLAAAQPKPAPKALVKAARQHSGRKNRVDVVVTLIAARRRLCDDDNNVASFKPLRDAIAESIGIDDGDPRLCWQYGQVESKGRQHSIVNIELL